MNLKKIIGRFAAVFTATTLAASAIYIAPEDIAPETFDVFAASDCVVDTTTEYQLIRGFGGINHPEWTGKDMTDSQRQTAFGNGSGEMGLSVLRVFVNPDKNQWNKAVPTAKFAQENGAYVFASPWEPPSSLAQPGDGSFQGGKVHLPKSNYGAYAQHLNDFGTYMKNQGVDLYSISVQNEPDYAHDWTGWTSDETTDFLANYGDKITSTRLMSPESFQYTNKDYYSKILNNSKAMANCDLFGTHMYGTQRSQMDFPALENCGKEIWMTEVYVPNSEADSANRWPEALKVSENIHNAMVVGNMSAYVWWYIRRSYGLMDENGKITKRGYNMSQYSKWVRPGDRRIEVTEQPASNVLVSAYKNDNKQVTIVAINKGDSTYTQSFSIGSGEKIIDVDRYRTSASENLALTENLENNGSGFFASLPAQSVSTFVVSLEGSGVTPGTQPDENGWFFHDEFEQDTCSWESRGESSILTSGRTAMEGKEALLVQERTSSWHGAGKPLNPKVFVPGQEFSFSADVMYFDGDSTTQFYMKLQYTGSDGEPHYSTIAEAKAVKGEWVQLANANYTIPADATDMLLYIETADTTNNFYIDEAIGALPGTKIEGPAPITFTLGDIDNDGVIDAFDVLLARKGSISGVFATTARTLAADVNQDGKNNIADAVMIQNYVLRRISNFSKSNSSSDDSSSDDGSSSQMRTISEYTPLVQAKIMTSEPESAKQQQSGVQYGTLQSKSYYSQFCGREKKYNVLLPAGYSTDKKYPVLYVMHGYWENQDRMIIKGNGTMYTKEIIGNAIAEGAAKDMIVVFPYIYSSQSQDDCSAMDDANNIAYDNFDTVLVNELMPLIEKEYSVATGRANTAITGFSMGGRESLNIAMKHPDLFGYVGAICPAPGASGAWKFSSEEAAPSLILITAGGNDTVVYSTPEGYHNNFTKNNVPHIWHYYESGYHGDNSIHAHLYNFVRAVFQA